MAEINDMLFVMSARSSMVFKNKWLSVYQNPDGYVFSHETRCRGRIVVVLGFSPDKKKFIGRYEVCPAHSPHLQLCSLTGGVEYKSDDLQKNIRQTAIMELEEEAGIVEPEEKLIDLGTVRPSKSADTIVYLFGIETDQDPVENPKGDGSKSERGAFCRWVSREDLVKCKDPFVHTMLLRLGL